MEQQVRVVVGVSGSLGGLAALHRAVAEARRLDGRVLALHVWEPPGGEFGYRRSPCPPLLSAVRDAAAARLADALAGAFGGGGPGVPLTAQAVRGPVAATLLAAAPRPVDLLVLGPSGSWLHRGLRPSVADRCRRRARCPVLVVPRPELAAVLDRPSSRRALDAELRELVAADPTGRAR